jgi:hypothetical protein
MGRCNAHRFHIIASAVAGELFPIMANNSETNSCAGITIGFAIGLMVVFGLERVVEYLENLPPNAFELLATVDRDEVLSSVHQGTAGLQ